MRWPHGEAVESVQDSGYRSATKHNRGAAPRVTKRGTIRSVRHRPLEHRRQPDPSVFPTNDVVMADARIVIAALLKTPNWQRRACENL